MNRYVALTFAMSLCVATLSAATAGETRSRTDDEPTVTQARASARQSDADKEAVVTRERAPHGAQSEGDDRGVRAPRLTNRPEPQDKEQLIVSPGPAARINLVPDEAETRCMRAEGQMRCTPVTK
jgi:hypothetical protein